jgi:hypothetical protein
METNTYKTKTKWWLCSYKENKIISHNDIDLFRKYINDIVDLKLLDKEMINNIRNMTNEDKMDIIITLNNVVQNLKIYIK